MNSAAIQNHRESVLQLPHDGRNAPRESGRILVATQVVEQSLDLDFDWMLCVSPQTGRLATIVPDSEDTSHLGTDVIVDAHFR